MFSDGAFVAIKIWRVPKTQNMPEGIKYSLAYIDSTGRRQVGYDVHHGKSHHRHVGEAELPYRFESIDTLVRDFEEEVRRKREGR